MEVIVEKTPGLSHHTPPPPDNPIYTIMGARISWWWRGRGWERGGEGEGRGEGEGEVGGGRLERLIGKTHYSVNMI